MTIQPILLQGKKLEDTIYNLIEEHEEFYWAVAWGSMSPLAVHLLKHKMKIKCFAIGTHFHQTDPKLLIALKDVIGARVVSNSSSGTFHPKMYLFKSRDKYSLVLGSPNFTNAAFQINTESALLIEGDTTEQIYLDTMRCITETWDSANRINDDFLRVYTLKHDATEFVRRELSTDLPVIVRKPGSKYSNLLEEKWPTFVLRVKADPIHDIDGRVKIMDQARVWFSQFPDFASMSEFHRKAIAGTFVRNETKPIEFSDLNWAWFGSMVGAGVFKSLVKSKPEGLSAALDLIPRSGAVNEADYERFKSKFLDSFVGEKKSGGLATASRLLAMKRPDYFVCVDSANEKKLSEAIGIKKNDMELDTYWTHIIAPILCSPWWNSDRPSENFDGRIWDARVACIDAFCYER